MEGRQFSWAIVQPSPRQSVKYLGSTLATSAAKQLSCAKYLAVVLEPSAEGHAVGYLVQSASHHPLPDKYLPISPCTLGTRDPLVPDFDWPFGECVINTGKHFVFLAVRVKSERDLIPHSLSQAAAGIFRPICRKDHGEQSYLDHQRSVACQKAARDADGAPDDVSRWTTFSLKSTYAPPPPGDFFPPTCVHGIIRYNIMSLEEILPASRCFEDEHEIKRLRARFSRPATERTIMWSRNQADIEVLSPPCAEPAPEFHPSMVEFCADIERAHSPDRDEEPTESEDDADPFWGMGGCDSPDTTPCPPPPLDPFALQILYFDVYGTLIDNESGIFDALKPLLAQSLHTLDRREALTFYFESEFEIKRRTPSAPYSKILALAHAEMAARLGLAPNEDQSAAFASSISRWPLLDGAVWCLRMLKPWVPALVALADVDHKTLSNTPAFAALAPYFAEVFTWDASRAYKPGLRAFSPALEYHDALDIPRKHRCLVSNGLLRDLEPAFELEIPAIWLRYPESLAGRVPSLERAVPVGVTKALPDLVLYFLRFAGAFEDIE